MKSNIVTGSARPTGFGVAVTLNVPMERQPGPAQRPIQGVATHSPDFSTVNWFGAVYYFATLEQQQAVGFMWHAAESGNEANGQATILDAADSKQQRLRDVFGTHPAWGTMIVQDMAAGPGHYKLSQPV